MRRDASPGPLKDMIPVFLDVETFMTKEINLSKMTLRQYLAKSYMESIAIALDEDAPEVYLTPGGKFKPQDECLLSALKMMAEDPQYVFVAHNAAFDIRVLRLCLGIPQPKNVWCSMEGSMCAWPELYGGYSLDNIAERLQFPKDLRKMEVDLYNITDEEKLEYNKQDVRVMQEIYFRQIALIPDLEQGVALRTHRQRQFHFEINTEKLEALILELDRQAVGAEERAKEHLSEDEAHNVFNRDLGYLKSVRPLRLRAIVNNKYGTNFQSTSLKKISPIQLAQAPDAAALLVHANWVSKMLSHKRRSSVFDNTEIADVELGYFRAHTGRFSSPSSGKGLNLHNVPKHEKTIAKPVREVFHLPKELCFVRADLANVEYRVEGRITTCKTVLDMFDTSKGGDIFNDPYCMAWKSMTGQAIKKKDPIRQVAKAAVLGLGFCMGAAGYAKTLLTALADKKSGVTEEVLIKIAAELNWPSPPGNSAQRIINVLGCSFNVAKAAFFIHKAFNDAHPEFKQTADWLVRSVTAIIGSISRERAAFVLEQQHESNFAPPRDMIELSIDDDPNFKRPSIRVKCGPWVRTVCWREPAMRSTSFANGADDNKLTIIKSTGQFKPFTRQLAIENVTQAAARNMLCWGVAELEKLGFPNVLHIHDEVMIIVPRTREAALAARDALIKVFGPKGNSPLGWATLIKPSEISVTESMWEDEMDFTPPFKDPKTGEMKGGDRWGKIERNEMGCLENLP